MEKKHKKRMIQVGMIGFFGYWLGRIFWKTARSDGSFHTLCCDFAYRGNSLCFL